MTALFNPFRAVADAAVGDIEAQRALADESVRLINERPEEDPATALREGLIFARMAAAHGNNGDHGRLIAMLALAADLAEREGDKYVAENMGGEAIARIAALADAGVELADISIGKLADEASPETMAHALHFQRLLREVI